MKKIAYIFFASMAFTACSSVECSLNHLVSVQYAFWSQDEGSQTLLDTMSVSIITKDGRDSLLLNRGIGLTNFALPMSYTADADTLYFSFSSGNSMSICDTLIVDKTNTPHFESVECEPNYFHTITKVTYTNHYIKSVAINNTSVEYETTEPHILLTLPAAE